jgi:hypothetical protein
VTRAASRFVIATVTRTPSSPFSGPGAPCGENPIDSISPISRPATTSGAPSRSPPV